MKRLLTSVLLFQKAYAFFGANGSVNPLKAAYIARGPSYDALDSIRYGYGDATTSFWQGHWSHLENGYGYMAVTGHSTAGLDSIATFVSLLDINTTQYTGFNNIIFGTITNQTLDVRGGGLDIYALNASDWLGPAQVDSTVRGATFNLTVRPSGQGLFVAGSGTWTQGPAATNQWGLPRSAVSGTVTVNGTQVAVATDQSVTWFSRFWGNGGADNGYIWFGIYLDNGVTLPFWDTNPITNSTQRSTFATVLFLDGHHETHIPDVDVHERGASISTSNVTYHSDFQLHLPTIPAILDVKIPVHVGELQPGPGTETPYTYSGGYATFNGTFSGKLSLALAFRNN